MIGFCTGTSQTQDTEEAEHSGDGGGRIMRAGVSEWGPGLYIRVCAFSAISRRQLDKERGCTATIKS